MEHKPIEIRPHNMITATVSSSDSGAYQENDWDDADNGKGHLTQSNARAIWATSWGRTLGILCGLPIPHGADKVLLDYPMTNKIHEEHDASWVSHLATKNAHNSFVVSAMVMGTFPRTEISNSTSRFLFGKWRNMWKACVKTLKLESQDTSSCNHAIRAHDAVSRHRNLGKDGEYQVPTPNVDPT